MDKKSYEDETILWKAKQGSPRGKGLVLYRWLSLALLALSLCIFSSQTAQAEAGLALINVTAAVPKEFPPYYMVSESGKPTGFAIDEMDQLAALARLKVTYLTENSWADAVEAVKTGRADLIPNVGISAERRAWLDFTAPVETFPISIFVRKHTYDIGGADDLTGHRVAAVKTNIGVNLLKDRKDLDLIVVDDARKAVLELLSGHVDALVYPAPVAMKIVRDAGIEERIKIVGKPLAEIKCAVGVRKGNPALLKRLNQAVKRFGGTAEYQQIYVKWFGRPKPFWTVRRVLLAMGILLLAGLAAMAAWRYRSTIRLNRRLVESMAERERVEEALRTSEEKFRDLIENLPVGVALSVPEGAITEMNQAMVKIFGYDSKEEFQEVPASARYVNPRDREQYLELLEKGLAKNFEAQYKRKDGTVFWARATAIKGATATGEIQFINVFEDITGRKLAEEALRESEKLFRELFDHMSSGVAIYDSPDNGESFVFANLNESGLKNDEKTKDEVIGREVRSIFPGVEALGLFDVFQRVWRTGIPEHHPSALYKDDKISLWVENYVCKLPSGKLVAIYEDTTTQKQAEEALRHSEERYSTLVEESFDGIFVQKGPKIIFANRRLHEMLGCNEGELVGLDHWLIYHPESQELTRKRALARMCGEEIPTHYEVKVQRKGGTWFYADLGARLISIEGEPGIQVWIRDITERRQAEEYLKKSEARLRSIFEASPLGICLTGKDRDMQWHNKAMAWMLGFSPEELRGKYTRVLYPDDAEFERVGDSIKTLGPGKRTTEIETRWVRKDGSTFDCYIRHALMDPESKDSLILTMVEDITERKKAEEEKRKLEAQFNQAQKMEAIGVLAGGVAHDFNNLLTSIIGNADLVLMNLDKDSPVNEPVEEIRKAGRRAAALTRQLLAFSRKELIRPEVLNLNSLMTDLEKMLRRLIGEDIELVTDYAPDPCRVEADPGQMEQVVMNLAVNARDAMPKGGKLIFETANVELDEDYFRGHEMEGEAGPYVMLAVTDSGTGMDEETRAHIFEPFFTTKEMGRGTGLGLSTVYGIVKQNKGHIWVYSEPGKGTTFKAYLPKAGTDAEPAKTSPSRSRSLEGAETILVVEDDEPLRKMTERMLKGYGYRILTARDGEEALQIAGTHGDPLHLMLTDVIMPGMNGHTLAEQMKSRIPELKVVYMSGYTHNAIARRGVLEKDVDLIQKPFTREGLAFKVREILDRKQN